MPKNFQFSDLVHEPDTFTDADGTVYEVRAATELGAVEMARAQRLQTQFPTWLDRLTKHPEDERAAQALEEGIAALVQIAIPGLPPARIAQMALGQKQAILDWWNALQAERKNGTSQAAS